MKWNITLFTFVNLMIGSRDEIVYVSFSRVPPPYTGGIVLSLQELTQLDEYQDYYPDSSSRVARPGS